MTANDATVAAQTPSIETDSVTDHRLTDDKVFHLLQNRRRRNVIRYLSGEEDTVSMRDIAEHVAAWEHDTSVAALSSDERQRVYIPLYQNHLPKLDDEGVIEYDQSRGTVKRTDKADQLETYLTDEPSATSPAPSSAPPANEESDSTDWTDAYLGATGLASAFFLSAVFNVPIIGGLSNILLSSLMLVTFATVTFAHAIFGSNASLPF